jgi:hypothetical protein
MATTVVVKAPAAMMTTLVVMALEAEMISMEAARRCRRLLKLQELEEALRGLQEVVVVAAERLKQTVVWRTRALLQAPH